MTDYEVSALTELTSPADGDLLLAIDVSDTSTAPAGAVGSDKKMKLSTLKTYVGSGGGGGSGGVDGWKNFIGDYDADNTGSTSASTALASACSDAVAAQPASFGLIVPPGTYKVTAAQDLPWNMTLRGAGGTGGDVTSQFTGSWFNVDSSFSTSGGSYVFGFYNNTTDHTSANGCLVSDIGIDGSAYSGAAVDGMFISGPVNVTLDSVTVSQMSGWGFNASGTDSSADEQFPYGQTWKDCTADSNGTVSGGGFNLVGCEDSVFTGCYALGNNSGPGFHIEACDNTKFTGCNAEWNSTYGFYVTGDWTYFVGGCLFTGCSTDANGQYGFYQDATWTTGQGGGTGPGLIQVTGCHFRRDGTDNNDGSTTANSAGIAIGATTLPLVISGFATYPGTPDGEASPFNPAYGVYLPESSYSAPIIIANGLAWGVTSGVKTSGSPGTTWPSNSTTFRSSSVILAVGANDAAPTYSVGA